MARIIVKLLTMSALKHVEENIKFQSQHVYCPDWLFCHDRSKVWIDPCFMTEKEQRAQLLWFMGRFMKEGKDYIFEAQY